MTSGPANNTLFFIHSLPLHPKSLLFEFVSTIVPPVPSNASPPALLSPRAHPPLRRFGAHLHYQCPLPLHRRRRRLLVRHHGPQLSPHPVVRTQGGPRPIHRPL